MAVANRPGVLVRVARARARRPETGRSAGADALTAPRCIGIKVEACVAGTAGEPLAITNASPQFCAADRAAPGLR